VAIRLGPTRCTMNDGHPLGVLAVVSDRYLALVRRKKDL